MAPVARAISSGKKLLFGSVLLVGGLVAGAAIGAAMVATGRIANPFDAPPEPAEQQARPRRILVAGDSFLSWWPIEHCLHRDMQAWCETRAIGLLNTAVGGYGPLEYAERIAAKAAAFRPGLVLIFYYAGNDATDALNRPGNVPRSRGAAWLSLLESAAQAADPPAPQGAEATAFDWQAMRDAGVDPELIELAKGRIAHPNDVLGGYVNPWLLYEAMGNPAYIDDNILLESERGRAAWGQADAALREAIAAAAAAGAEVCLIAIPSTVQVSRSHWDFYRRCKFDLDPRVLGSTAPQERLRALCAETGAAFVDLLPAFRAAGETLYWTNDDHLNEAGHVLALEVLRREFLDAWEHAGRPADEARPPAP